MLNLTGARGSGRMAAGEWGGRRRERAINAIAIQEFSKVHARMEEEACILMDVEEGRGEWVVDIGDSRLEVGLLGIRNIW